MKLTEIEIKLLMSVPMTYEILYAKMLTENIGTDKRRELIRNKAIDMRKE